MAKPIAVAYFGSAEEKERFLTELRAEMAAQALDHGGWECPYVFSLSRLALDMPLWLPRTLHALLHTLASLASPAAFELALFEAIEPGADLMEALRSYFTHLAFIPTEEDQRRWLLQSIRSCPVRKVP